MLADIRNVDAIYLVCGYTDMRKSIDGLCAIIETELKMNSNSNCLYLFCGRRCDRIKGLMKEKDGYVLIYKRLSAYRGRYHWPRSSTEARSLSWKEFEWLMDGLDFEELAKKRISC